MPDGREVELRRLVLPAAADAPGAADFLAMVEVRNAIKREVSGHDDHAVTPEALLPHYRSDPDEDRLAWLVLVGGHVVGRAGLDIPLAPGSRVAYWLIELLAEATGRGYGSVALALIEQTARERGRTVLQSWAEHPERPGPRRAAPTGFGSVPDDRIARFYERHGYRLEQVERISAFDLFADPAPVQTLLASATRAAEGYRTVQWELPTPAEYVDGYAWMKSRMATDVPAAGLEVDEEAWDAERVARHDARWLDGGHRMLVTAAEHIATGDLVAYNELVIGTDPSRASSQEDTLVLADHRGHRLGTLVKAAGILAWRRFAPDSPRIITYNAEENRPMLDVNEALGFAPIAYESAWKKTLPRA